MEKIKWIIAMVTEHYTSRKKWIIAMVTELFTSRAKMDCY